jgi:hypothetical protein
MPLPDFPRVAVVIPCVGSSLGSLLQLPIPQYLNEDFRSLVHNPCSYPVANTINQYSCAIWWVCNPYVIGIHQGDDSIDLNIPQQNSTLKEQTFDLG